MTQIVAPVPVTDSPATLNTQYEYSGTDLARAAAITAAAEHLTAAGFPPSVAYQICPVPADASALKAAMKGLARVESASVALIREASRR